MEDVLEVYQRPYDPKRPMLCLDEIPVQLLGEERPAQPCRPGRNRREDYQYQRNGTANVFMVFEPLAGYRQVRVTQQRTKQDFAALIRDLLHGRYKTAQKLVLVMDNLNTHTPGSLYEALAPEEARELTARLEIHYTPTHGSWLNMAEIELSVLSRQCLRRRLGTRRRLQREAEAWQRHRNKIGKTADWQFTTADARIRLKRLYPSMEA